MPTDLRIPHAQLVRAVRDALTAVGMLSPACDVEAHVMAEADLLGVPSHGVRMLPGLIQGIRSGRVNPNPQIKITRDHLATCVLDGDNGPGRCVSVQAMQHAVERAKKFGLGACAATGLSHWGRAHAYASRAAQAGVIGICTTNSVPNMVAWGSTRPLLGNNPLAIAVPRGHAQEPIVLDMAMSQAAIGKVRTFLREGKKVPANWGLDASGQPSDDPATILSSGRILPFGDHKGAGLAFIMELLTGALSGGLFSQEVAKADTSGLDSNSAKLFLALNVSAFTDLQTFGQRVEEYIAWLRAAEPGLTITLPGERGWQTRDENLATGIPLHPDIVTQLKAINVNLK